MRLVIELFGVRAQELHLSEAIALLQLDSVLNRHAARGHTVTRFDDSYGADSHYKVATPEGTIEYWLKA